MFLLHGLISLGQQDTLFASTWSNDTSRPCVGRNQVKAGSTTSLDNICGLSCQSHQDLIPNVLNPSIDLQFKNTLMSLRKLSRILASLWRIYTIWMRRAVSRTVKRMNQVENTSFYEPHVLVQDTSYGVQILNLLPLLNVFWQMKNIVVRAHWAYRYGGRGLPWRNMGDKMD